MGNQRTTKSKTTEASHQGRVSTVTQPPLSINSPVHPILQLQQQLGNQAVNRLIQTKMTVGPPGDIYEQEADQVAATVMRTPAPQVQRQPEEEEEIQTKQITPLVQRQSEEEDEKVQMLQRQAEEEEEKVQAKAIPGQTPQVSPNLEAQIQSRRGGGKPLSTSTRAFMEPRFGHDFSSVRVHTDSHAVSAASELNAQAFTTGQDIFFGSGSYEPHTTKGKSLLAHELTHTIQQQPNTARMLVQRRDGMNGSETVTTSPTIPVQAPPSPTPATSLPVQEPPSPTPATSLPVQEPPSPTPGSPPASETQAPEAAIPATSPEESVAPPAEMTEETTESVSAEAAQESTIPQPMGETSAVGVELLMPEPPSELSEEAQSRLDRVQSNAAGAAAAESELPDAEANVAGARGAVEEPEEETSARAGEALVEALGERPQPSPEIEALCQRIYQAIRSKRPPDEESLVDADPTEAAQEAGGQLNQSIEGNVEQVEASYDQLDQQPEGTPQQQPQELEVPPETVETPEIGSEAAVPDPVPPEAVSLDADVAASGTRMEEAGMNTEAAQLVQSGPIAEAREAQGELQETAERDPAEVMAEQQEALASASADMAALQEAALNALTTSRTSTVSGVHGQQTEMVGSEEEMRTQIGAQAQEIFANAQSQVNDLLTPLSQTAMNRWETGVAVLSEEFRQHLSRVKRWVDERHESLVLAAVDYLAGLPDWVTDEYDEAEQAFGDGVCNLIREISAEVNGVIATCEAIIDQARQDIDNLFTNLPEELQEWAASEQERFNTQLDGLHQQVMETRDNFNRDLANRASQSVQDVRQQIHELRQAAGGLIGRVADAVNRFLEDPAKFIIEGLLELLGIAPSAFWAVVNRIGQVINDIADDPLGFAENLLAAIGQGFSQFFDKIGDYLLSGLLEWLFSGLGAVGVQVPADFSLSSIITFFLQLMGITWERIRGLLARHIGEENVALIEQAYELIANLIAMGPQGIFEMIKEQLNPQNILDMVLQAAIDFFVETLIRQVSVRVIALFNPVGAIVQAIEAIYKVLKWIFENAARIFSLVETVVNGMADIIAGNVGGMANAVEEALARLLAPVIDFFADFAGLGNLPDRIADTIRGFQEWVESILERVIAWLAERARALLRSLGIGGEEEEPEGMENVDPEVAMQIREGLAAIPQKEERFLTAGKLAREDAQQVATEIKREYPVFQVFNVIDGGDSWDYHYEANPEDDVDENRPPKEEGDAGLSINTIQPMVDSVNDVEQLVREINEIFNETITYQDLVTKIGEAHDVFRSQESSDAQKLEALTRAASAYSRLFLAFRPISNKRLRDSQTLGQISHDQLGGLCGLASVISSAALQEIASDNSWTIQVYQHNIDPEIADVAHTFVVLKITLQQTVNVVLIDPTYAQFKDEIQGYLVRAEETRRLPVVRNLLRNCFIEVNDTNLMTYFASLDAQAASKSERELTSGSGRTIVPQETQPDEANSYLNSIQTMLENLNRALTQMEDTSNLQRILQQVERIAENVREAL